MAVTPVPAFAQAVRAAACVCTAAKTTLNDGTNAVLLCTAGTNGSLITRLGAYPRATVTATQLQVYIYDGANYYLAASALMAAYTMANTTAIPSTAIVDANGNAFTFTNPLDLQSGWSLYAGAAVALAGGIVFQADIRDL